jgi:hypothetical protein
VGSWERKEREEAEEEEEKTLFSHSLGVSKSGQVGSDDYRYSTLVPK